MTELRIPGQRLSTKLMTAFPATGTAAIRTNAARPWAGHRLARDQPELLKRQHHLMNRRWCHPKEPLQVGLGVALSPVSTGKRLGMKNPLLTQSFSTAA
jgi:hypothetical protein